MCPTWKHLPTGQPMGELMFNAIKDLGAEIAAYMESLSVRDKFTGSEGRPKGSGMPNFIFYATPRTAFNRMVDVFTLGGRLIEPEMDRAIETLRILWSARPTDDEDISPQNPHRCAGVMFKFEIWPGAKGPVPKIYLPAAYYGKPNLEIAEGMDVFKSQGWDQPFHSYKQNFVKAL
ncbi:hypothetical protein Asppvi_005929 [Aspergillus pseudoviridinutans]|uniref:Uncharacterized protein n=1 Tax=Aspergillus pseudoviridinutans TaxID=1517512 RepID=A0A9P3B976_9EURO|nr:uncharacterized protein Asppvi_005929 [Aspergillus pseudoviridinutans]GIJ87027.1 hypothetical protein Asppvi_005929 [Aspergillus pseudoviridinutans]